MEARNRELPKWFSRIGSRQITLPRFQRFEAWTHERVSSLLSNVLFDLPAGSVLILEVGESEQFISRPMVGAPDVGDRVTEHLLDGQQRLTALWRSLNNDYEDRSFFVCLKEDEETGDPYFVVSKNRYRKDGKRYPLWLDDAVQLWANALIPVHLLRPDNEAETDLDDWVVAASGGDPSVMLEITKQASQLRQKFASYNIPFLSLPSTVSRETALNVFIQMNTSAAPLSAYDIVVAQVEAGTGTSLHDLVDELNHDIPEIQAYADAADLMLAVSALLQDRPPTKSTYLSTEFSNAVVDSWDTVRTGMDRAARFLRQEGIFDARRLPSDVSLYPLCALWGIAPEGLDAEGEARTTLRKYLWRSFFTDRYERTSATRSLVDFRQISKVLNGDSKELPLVFDDDEYPLASLEELILAGWPVRKDRLPRALLAIALREGGLDFADGAPAERDHLPLREYHHLFPRAYLKQQERSSREIDRVLNCALVSWKTNRNISAKEPKAYLMERIDGSSLGEDEVRRRLESHLIPFDEFVAEDYEAFLEARAQLLHAKMLSLCLGLE